MSSGFVYLIGAGPGDPGLISEKAVEALQSSDCIVYDFLANERIIKNTDCEKIYVGKRGSSHTLSQDKINSLIIDKAKEGKTVARLKGGDPFIFGRGGEEAEELVKEGIPFSVIPGISSFYSAPAYAGIPLTHRDYANSFEVITGHRRSDASDDEDINFPEYNSQKTYTFLMGMKNLGYITGQLIKKGFPEDTPAAVVTNGTSPAQRVCVGILENIADIADKNKMGPPAIIIIGGVVLLREKLRWFDALPLFGKRIVVTRTREQASVLSKRLCQLGAEVTEFPTIEIIPREDQSFLYKALEGIEQYGWIIFTSQNAVKIFFRALFDCSMDSRSLFRNRIAAIGPASAKEIENYSIKPDLIPGKYVAEALVEVLAEAGVSGKRILLPCAQEARQTLKHGLEELGASVDRIHIYDTSIPDNLPEEILHSVKTADMITFTSSSTVRNFFKVVESTDARIACIGPITAETARGLGHAPDLIADEFTIDGLVNAIVKDFKGG